MNTSFKITNKKIDRFDIVVFSTTCDNILSHLEDISMDIQSLISDKKDDHLVVLFDTYLFSNNSSERFIYAEYAQNKFVKGSFKFTNLFSNEAIMNFCKFFFITNLSELGNLSILTNTQVKELQTSTS